MQANLTGYKDLDAGLGYSDSDNLNLMLGYQNTKAINEFNNASENAGWPVEAVSGLSDFNATTPAPEGTSGWYLPSVKEVSLFVTGVYDENIFDIWDPLTDNKELLNGILSQISGADQIDDVIMSSTEQGGPELLPNDLVHTIDSSSGYNSLGGNEFKDSSWNYRYVLAF